jgi:hypothetical protein
LRAGVFAQTNDPKIFKELSPRCIAPDMITRVFILNQTSTSALLVSDNGA